jgi:gentisate 1,2-dioxygenase
MRGHVLATLTCHIQMLRSGVHIDWTVGDFLAIPPWARHKHVNEGDEPG